MSALLTLQPGEQYRLTIQPKAVELKTIALSELATLTTINSQEDQARAADILSRSAGIVKQMETSRVDVKAPVLDAAKRIDAQAKEFSSPIEAEMARAKKLVSDYADKERRRIDEENRRIEEERRRQAAEAERARIAEERRIQCERAVREREDRLRRESEAAEEAARIAATQEKEDPLAALRQSAAEAAEQERQEAERLRREEEERRLANLEAARLSQESLPAVPIRTTKIAGIAPRVVWKFEVLDLKQVYAARPDLCALAISPAQVDCRIREGLRECPGLRIYEETVTHVRAR
jgi:hypothetical protein